MPHHDPDIPDPSGWCAGPCMDTARRRAATYQRDREAYAAAMMDWRERGGHRPVEPEPPKIHVVPGDPVFCGLCRAQIRQALVELDDLACVLAAAADGHRPAADGPRVSGSASPGSPSPTVELLDELESWLRSWRARQAGTSTWARTGLLAQSITTQSTWLLARLDVMLARDFAEEFGRGLLSWHGRLARGARADVRVERKPLRCPGCRWTTLEWRVGSDVVTCRRVDCRHELSLDEYEALVDQAREKVGAA